MTNDLHEEGLKHGFGIREMILSGAKLPLLEVPEEFAETRERKVSF